MTIDERLEKLTERHEALTQTVELVASMQRENERSIDKLVHALESLVQIVRNHEDRIDRLKS